MRRMSRGASVGFARAACYTAAVRLFARKPPWYAAGLAFECVGCGRCCAGPEEGYVWVTPEEVAAIAAYLGRPAAEVMRRYVRCEDGRLSLVEDAETRDCVFLNAPSAAREGAPAGPAQRTCAIYPVRPMQCRTWPFWAHNLTAPGAWARAGRRCPGINRGQRFACDEILAKRNATGD